MLHSRDTTFCVSSDGLSGGGDLEAGLGAVLQDIRVAVGRLFHLPSPGSLLEYGDQGGVVGVAVKIR